MANIRSNMTIRRFCPLVLYHDNPTTLLTLQNQPQHRIMIDRHRIKTEEMLQRNAQVWIETSFHSAREDHSGPNDDSNSVHVSPSTSTSSSSSASSNSSLDSSGDNVYPQTVMPVTVVNTSPRMKVEDLLSINYPPQQDKLPNVMLNPTNAKGATAAPDTVKKRRRGNLSKEVTEYLKSWLVDHKKHPYPSEKEKAQLAARTSLTVNQISNWFINARRRILQPMLESENFNSQLMPYSEMPTIEQKKQRQLDIYAYQGFADNFQDDSRKWAFRRTKLPAFDSVEMGHYSLAMR